ncbi:MAG: DUF559 domain-containing protein [Chitinophagaceae bacterium]|nr:DUF559 domain-containing protein [Chitinophagaceae bacterium]
MYRHLKDFAVQQKQNPTEAEKVLWQLLKGKKLDSYKFRRQHIILQFISDFVCLSKKLIIELDGGVHDLPESKINDQQRTEILESKGYKVLRFKNDEILQDSDNVLNKITEALNHLPEADNSNKDAEVLSFGEDLGEAASDHIGAFSVTIKGIEPHLERFIKDHDDYNKIMLQSLTDRLAEAFAECLHERVRKEFWGYVKDEHLSNDELIKEKYQGIRPAPGYPACPDHTEKYKLFELLGGEKATGIHLTESLAMYPAASVCGWYFSHPQSQYFGVGKIQPDQFEDYFQRKGMSREDLERWLRPVME